MKPISISTTTHDTTRSKAAEGEEPTFDTQMYRKRVVIQKLAKMEEKRGFARRLAGCGGCTGCGVEEEPQRTK